MKIGIPKEIKTRELRVAVTPIGVRALIEHGHKVFVESSAGRGAGFGDNEYQSAGACILQKAEDVWGEADIIVKVKEPVSIEFDHMKPRQILFTFLHLAADEHLTKTLLQKKVTGIAYETIQLDDGTLPLLAPMSEVAGRLSVQMACYCLEAKNGGRGILVSGIPGVAPAKVTIIGAGIAGINAAHLAIGIGAQVTILDVSMPRLRHLEDIFHSRAVTLMSNSTSIAESIAVSDIVIGSVLIPGAKAPKLIAHDMIKNMRKGTAIVDIAIDQGGCAETSKPTTHDNPIYLVDDVVHYCVSNMPGAVPRTSTQALTNVTIPYVLELADKGVDKALSESKPLMRGLNTFDGAIIHKMVAEAFGMKSSACQLT